MATIDRLTLELAVREKRYSQMVREFDLDNVKEPIVGEIVSSWIDHALEQPESLDLLAKTWLEHNLGMNPKQIDQFLGDPDSHISIGQTVTRMLQMHFNQPELRESNAKRARNYWTYVGALHPEMLTAEQYQFLQLCDSEKMGLVGIVMMNIFNRVQSDSQVVAYVLDAYNSAVFETASSVA